jgi:hypothetical protein
VILDPAIPLLWIIALAVAMLASAAYFQWRSGLSLNPARRALLLVLRISALAIIVFLLLQPSREEKVPVPSIPKSVVFAIDTSASMAEPHDNGATRIDALRADLETAGVLSADPSTHRFFNFDEKAYLASAESILKTPPLGKTSRFHTSIAGILKASPQPPPAALFILSDGHDFELVPPGQTARLTRARDLPVFTIPYGTTASARDISVSIANYHPHTFIRQKTRLEAIIRVFGCEHESINIDLLRDGKKVDGQVLETGTKPFLSAGFDVIHEEPAQYEYTFRVSPVANERELTNNTATTYLNVISERIRILEIEGQPFWDSTFLRRSFSRNDKFDIDSLVAFTGNRVRPIRSNPDRTVADLKVPANVDDLMPYNIIVLGRDVGRVIGLDGIRAIGEWVKDHGGILVFSRGKAWPDGTAVDPDLEPIVWDTGSPRGARIAVTPQAGSVPAFKLLREVAAEDLFPEVIAYPAAGDPKTLASTFSVAEDDSPTIVYRRFGSGQTISLGVGNLWRWVFNPKVEYDNNAYDRFWDQLSLWLLANGGVTPIEGYSLRTDTSNLVLGETISFRFSVHGIEAPKSLPAISLVRDDKPAANLTLTPDEGGESGRAEFTPTETGRYSAEITTPDGKKIATRFIVFREDMERTETAMDRTYLAELANASGGKMIAADEIAPIIKDLLRSSAEQDPLTRRVPIWDKPWIFLLLCFLLGLEWYNRRRWGLT